MKLTLILSLLLSLSVFGDPPKKKQARKFSSLWQQSLITEEPEIIPVDENKVNRLDDYALTGWTRNELGFSADLVNTKNPQERISITPGRTIVIPENVGGEDYEVLKVEKHDLDYKKTKLLVKAGNDEKWLTFDERFLTPRQPVQNNRRPNSNSNNNNRGRSNGANNNRNQNNNNRNQANPLNSIQQQQQRQQQQQQQQQRTNQQNGGRGGRGQGQSAERRTPRVRRVPTPPTN